MRKKRFAKYSVPKYIEQALQILRPPEKMTVSEWAEKYRVLDDKTSARPGKWRNETTPYLKGIMDAMNDYSIERIAFCKPTQVGGTEAMQNMLGYVISQDPGPAMVVYPTEVLGTSTSEERIQPMLRLSPALRNKWEEYRSTDMELHFTTMNLTLAWANSPSALASKPIRYLFMDEVDKYPGASNKEADPLSLAKERTKTFHNKKIYVTSTPTLKTGHIWKALESSDVIKHYFVPCPHCGEMIEFKFSNVRFPSDKNLSFRDRADMASYVCQECGCFITDADKQDMLRHGEWRVVESHTENPRSVGFWMNTLYSPFVKFSDVAFEFLTSKDDPEKLQNFTNSWLAEPWEDTNLKTNADMVLQRQTGAKEYVVPEWAELLTAGVDVQQNCLYWTVRAWGQFMTSQNIAHGQALSLAEVTKVMNMEFYKKSGGEPMLVSLCLVDSGFSADDIYEYCLLNAEWALPCKGSSSTTLATHYRISQVSKDTAAHGMRLIIIDTGKYKDMISARIRRENGQGAWMVYKDCDREYAEQVTAEHKIQIRNKGKAPKYEWRLKSTHADNHYLDCEVYAACAADLCGVRTMYLRDKEDEEIQEHVEEVRANDTQSDWIKPQKGWL